MSKVQFNKIRNWTDLQDEKRRLTAHLDAKEGLLRERLSKIRNNGRDIIYNKVLIPLSVMSIGAVLIRLFKSMADQGSPSEANTEQTYHQESSTSGHRESRTSNGWFSSENIEVMAQAAKILLPVVIAAFASDHDEDDAQDHMKNDTHSDTREESKEADKEKNT